MPAYRTILSWLMNVPSMTSRQMAQRGVVNASAHISSMRQHGAKLRVTCEDPRRGVWRYQLLNRPCCPHGAPLLDACSACGRRAR